MFLKAQHFSKTAPPIAESWIRHWLSPLVFVTSQCYIFRVSIVLLSFCYVIALFSTSVVSSYVCYVTIGLFIDFIVSLPACYVTALFSDSIVPSSVCCVTVL